VSLWPETAALLANPGRLSRLTDDQQGWLRRAAADAAVRSTSFFEREAPLVRSRCREGARFSNASVADLASLRRAFVPVYAALAHDPQTKELLEQIEELKRATPPGRATTIPPGCAGPAPGTVAATVDLTDPSVVNGVYRVSWTQTELLAAGPLAAYARTSYGVITLTLRDGRYRFHPQSPPECSGRYSVSRTVVTIRADPATYCQGVVTARWSLRAGDLRLRVIGATDPGDRLVWGGKPWKKIG
jgi:hypothetical protein